MCVCVLLFADILILFCTEEEEPEEEDETFVPGPELMIPEGVQLVSLICLSCLCCTIAMKECDHLAYVLHGCSLVV